MLGLPTILEWAKELLPHKLFWALTVDLGHMTSSTHADSDIHPSKLLFPQQEDGLLELYNKMTDNPIYSWWVIGILKEIR